MTHKLIIVFGGDSISGIVGSWTYQSLSVTSVGNDTEPVVQASSVYSASGGDILALNMAITGTRLNTNGFPDLVPLAPVYIDPVVAHKADTSALLIPRKYLFVDAIGSNDSALGGLGSPTAYAVANAAAAVARKTAGFDLCAMVTLLPRSADMVESDRLAYNAFLTDPSWRATNNIDYVVDLASESTMGNPATTSNTTYYVDGVHPTSTGFALLAPIAAAVWTNILSGTAFQVDFTAISVLPAQVTLTRASAGTYFDSSGVRQSAAIDAPRFDHDPATLAGNGLLIEESRTNSITHSTDVTIGAWIPALLLTITATTGIDGTSSAFILTPDTSSNPHYLVSNTISTSSPFILQTIVTANGYSQVALRESNSIGSAAVFSLLSGGSVVGYHNAAGLTASDAKIRSMGNGRFLISCLMTPAGSGNFNLGIIVMDGTWTVADPVNIHYTGNGTNGIIVECPQFEVGAFPTSYIPTTTAAATRSADVALLTGTATTALEGSAASAILEAQLFATTPAGTEVLFGKSPVSYSFVRTSTTLSFFSGGADLTATFGSGDITTAFRTAISFDAGTRNIVINGGTLVSGATISAVTGDVPLGGFASGSQIATGWYRKMAIYASRQIDAQLTSKSVVGTPF